MYKRSFKIGEMTRFGLLYVFDVFFFSLFTQQFQCLGSTFKFRSRRRIEGEFLKPSALENRRAHGNKSRSVNIVELASIRRDRSTHSLPGRMYIVMTSVEDNVAIQQGLKIFIA